MENENLKRRLADQDRQHREELDRIRLASAQETATKVSGIEAKQQKKTAEMEARVTRLEHVNELARRRVLQINEVACTTKALHAAKNRHGEYAVPKLVQLAIEVTALRIDNGKDGHWSSADFDVVPYQTNEGWNVFICHKGQLSTMPTILRVNEFALKRALG